MKGPEGKYIFGLVKVGEKGQIVIPQEARKVFDIKSGDSLLVVGDIKQGIAILKSDFLHGYAKGIFNEKEIDEESK